MARSTTDVPPARRPARGLAPLERGINMVSQVIGRSNKTPKPAKSELPPMKGPCKILCQVDELPLLPGRYTLSLALGIYHDHFLDGRDHDRLLDVLDHAVVFEIEPGDLLRWWGQAGASTMATSRPSWPLLPTVWTAVAVSRGSLAT